MIKALAIVLLWSCSLFASGGEAEATHNMTLLVVELGVIIFAARLGGGIVQKFHFPSVLGELVAGIIIGPYLLGSIGFGHEGGLFFHGLFPRIEGALLPVSPELYGVSTIASIILLFMAGLETDLKLFLRFSLAGSIVGIAGVAVSFIVGDLTSVWLIDSVPGFMHPRALFLGVMCTATSVGITVRILSEKRKLDTPEGVTILAGAVIDDILGIILLAVIVGIAALETGHGSHAPDWGSIGMIGVKAIGVWLGFTALGLIFADRIAQFLKFKNSRQTVSILGLGLALLLAGIFEEAGLAMIIGAYVMGLTLSKTDLNFTIQEYLEPLKGFFVPIFFTTMGMMVDVHAVFTKEAIMIGGIYTIGAILSKLIGSGVPALFLNFNKKGALRIGLGMVPRGEVTLIIAGVGLANGIIEPDLFSIAVIMTLTSTLVAPVLLSRALNIPGKGTRKEVTIFDTSTLTYEFPSVELAELVEHKILMGFQGEGFMLHRLEIEEGIYNIQKEHTLLIFKRDHSTITINSPSDQLFFIRSLVYEMLVELSTVVTKVKDLAQPEALKQSIADISGNKTSHTAFDVTELLHPECISLNLRGTSKDEIISELLQLLVENGVIKDIETAKSAVLEREAAISTGMQFGLAIPHGRIAEVDELHVAIGISKEGINFGSLDGEPSHVFVLTIVPSEKKVPYVQFLAAVSAAMSSKERVDMFKGITIRKEVIDFFKSDA